MDYRMPLKITTALQGGQLNDSFLQLKVLAQQILVVGFCGKFLFLFLEVRNSGRNHETVVIPTRQLHE